MRGGRVPGVLVCTQTPDGGICSRGTNAPLACRFVARWGGAVREVSHKRDKQANRQDGD